MDRPTHSQARLTLAIVATLAACSAVMAPTSLAEAPASEEYLLDFPGVRQSSGSSVAPDQSEPSRSDARQGVVGEAETPESPLGAMVSSLGSTPIVMVSALAVLLSVALATMLSTRSRTHEAR